MHMQEIKIKSRVYNYHFNYLVKAFFTSRHANSKSIKMLSLHYHELMGTIKEHEEKNI